MAMQDSTNPLQGVSGPGTYSKRTDLEYQAPEYGAGVAYQEQKSGAPLAKTPDVRGASTGQVQAAAAQAAMGPITPLYAPTARPEEHVTSGIDLGPGANSNALIMQSKFAQQKVSDALAQMLPYDSTGEVGILYQQALARGM